ncbi:murein hydrolase activator EnvC family protein [Halomonas halodenitrificans]|uniref:murein hydrolase activator EnvC family protein n=1 Tax=Halomonas halodenitrificans TaxID=28252 RepID=UPI00048854AC|nr:peptidoglycan DD-metalloendopeptidase family protein [Halomonas halodenitrificans]
MARVATPLAALLLTLCLAGPLAAQPSEEAVQEHLDAIGDAIEEADRRLSSTRQARDEAARQLKAIETSLATTHRRLDALQAEQRELGAEMETLQSRRDELDTERSDQLEAINTQLDGLYRLGRSPQLKLLLNQDDPARLDRLQHYLNHLARARRARLDELAHLEVALAETRRQLDTRGERLDALAAELAERSAELVDQRRERAGLIARLDSRHSDEAARLASLEQDRERAEQVLRDVQEQLARLQRPPPSTAIERTRGELPWPVQGNIVSRFGAGEAVHHNGILIQAAEGSPVHAVHAGRVVFADWLRGFGNLLIIDHGDGVMTLHAHLQHFSAQVGRPVSQGEAIGAVGMSGGHRHPALYFEVRRGGDPIDPQAWIARR